MVIMVQQLTRLLSKLNVLVAEEKKRQEEKLRRGESFNVFSILKMESNETATHSAILAELLKVMVGGRMATRHFLWKYGIGRTSKLLAM